MIDFIALILELVKIPYTREGIEDALIETPHWDSFYGMDIIMKRYHINHECIRVESVYDIMNLNEIPIVIFNGRFAVIKKISDNILSLSFSRTESKSISVREFISKWNYCTLLVSSTPDSSEPNYDYNNARKRQFRILRIGVVIAFTALFLTGIIQNEYNSKLEWWLMAGINMIGVIIGIFLLQKQFGISNRLVDKICSNSGENHCDKVTNSEGAHFLGVVTLSEMAISYFGINLLITLTFGKFIEAIGLISICVIPLTLWSLWYQKTKAKNWCILCLFTIGVMWMQTTTYLLFDKIHLDFKVIFNCGFLLSLYALATIAVH